MLNISHHYIEEARKTCKTYEKQLASAEADLERAEGKLRYALQSSATAKTCPELKRVSKQFKIMVAFPTHNGIYVQLGNVPPESAEQIKQYLEVEMEFKPEVMGGGSVIYYSPVGHQYFVRYL